MSCGVLHGGLEVTEVSAWFDCGQVAASLVGRHDTYRSGRFSNYTRLFSLWLINSPLDSTQLFLGEIRICSGSALLSPGWRWHQPLGWFLAQPVCIL